MVKSRRGRAGGTVTAARGCWWRRRNAVLRHGEPQYAWRPVAVKGRWQTGQVLVPVSSRDGSAFVAVSSRDGPAASSWRRVWTGAGGGLSFDEAALVEPGAGAGERDEVGRVDRPPPLLGGLDELERHGQAGGLRARAFRHLRPVTDGGERRLDRGGGAQVHPVLGGEVVERQQLVDVVGDLGDGLAELGAVGQLERRHGAAGVLAVLGVPDLGQGLLR